MGKIGPQEVSDGKNISKWPRDHSCEIDNVDTFCPCPKNPPEAKLKSFRLMSLAEGFKTANIDHMT